MIPLFGVFFGWVIRGEVLGIAEFVGGLLIVAGVCVVVTGGNKRRVSAG